MAHFGRLRRDDGNALVVTVASMAVLIIFVVAALELAVNNIKPSRRDQDWNAAMAAAQAGVDDYLHHLNVNDSYWLKENEDPTNLAFKPGWVQVSRDLVPGYPQDVSASYQYTVLDNRNTMANNGTIRVKVTGDSRGVQRTIVADLRKVGFLKFLYFTDYETKDPALESNPTWAAANCEKYYYDGRKVDGSGNDCTAINFVNGDVINGPLHTNDAMLVGGAVKFKSETTETSWQYKSGQARNPSPTDHLWWGNGTPATGSGNYWPVYADTLQMPPTNGDIKNAADSAVGGTGCLYTGPTRIVLRSDGKMDVVSPQSNGSKAPPAACGTNLDTKQTVNLPANGVVYVQRSTVACSGTVLNDSSVPGGPYPLTDDSKKSTYSCNAGDVFIEGQLKGQLTVAADNNVVVTGNTTYAGGHSGADVLGLVANNYAYVYHPVDSSGNNIKVPAVTGSPRYLTDITIEGAILSVLHSFTVQSYDQGSQLGNLTVFGVIAQKFRGPVGTGSGSCTGGGTGYCKSYSYDSRLMVLPPPSYLKPVAAPWGSTQMSEQKNP